MEGTDAIKLNLENITELTPPYYAYTVDGCEPTRKPITEPEIALLDNNFHIVRVVVDSISVDENKWEKGHGFAFVFLDSNGGKIYGTEQQSKTVMFFGDSIIADCKSQR